MSKINAEVLKRLKQEAEARVRAAAGDDFEQCSACAGQGALDLDGKPDASDDWVSICPWCEGVGPIPRHHA